jgi:regulator of RNase E activity RraA
MLFQRALGRPILATITSQALKRRQVRSMATKEQLQALRNYTACDISDALLKLKVPNSGFLPDLNLYTPLAASETSQVLVAPASTVLFIPKSATDLSSYPEGNVAAGKHYVDLTEPETIVVISQPKGQICAALGGIMALRMKICNAKGVVVHGRVRDVEELASTGLPVSILPH